MNVDMLLILSCKGHYHERIRDPKLPLYKNHPSKWEAEAKTHKTIISSLKILSRPSPGKTLEVHQSDCADEREKQRQE